MKPARRAWRRLGAIALSTAIVCALTAHVGSSNAYFEGMAGPYPLRVIVRTPGVIPGLAQISVRVTDGTPPTWVTVRPLRWDAGLEGAPPPDTAVAVPGEPGLYSAELWLMTFGSYSVRVEVSGSAGDGVALVPVLAQAERRLDMGSGMAIGLLGGALFLFVGAVTVLGASVREAVLEPGAVPDAARWRRAAVVMGVGGVVMAAILWGGWAWWGAVDEAYRAGIFRPLQTSSSVTDVGGGRLLTLNIDDPEWRGRQWTPLLPDHGKLMHMFLVRGGDFGAFAHLHPESADSASFVVPFPPLPPGDYRVYADIVHESGFAQTLVDTVAVTSAPDGAGASALERDTDDSWAELPGHGSATAERFALEGGRHVTWVSGRAPAVDEEVTLGFRVTGPDGTPTALEPYMGMLSHAAVTTDDGSVFMHLHPGGSINMAAQRRFQAQDSAAAVVAPATVFGGAAPGEVRFPFAFPTAGSYRIFVQVKVDGMVHTAAFDVDVPGA